MRRRNVEAGPMPSWSTAGLQSTGLPRVIDRNLAPIRPELRPRTYETNDGRTTGGDLGLGGGWGPIGRDTTRPPSSTPPPADAPAVPEGCTDCG